MTEKKKVIGKRTVRKGPGPLWSPRRCLLCLAAITALLLSSCRSQQAYGFQPERSRKSVIVGELLAIFPGLLWHGLGHRYAQDHKKAEEIELMEAISLVSMGAGTGLVFAGRSNDNLRFMEYSGYAVGGMGAVIFLGGWLYDIIYTPSAVDRYNRALEESP